MGRHGSFGTKAELKMGDRVKLVGLRGTHKDLRLGDFGRLAEEDDGCPYVEWERTGLRWSMQSADMELAANFAVGDKVRYKDERVEGVGTVADKPWTGDGFDYAVKLDKKDSEWAAFAGNVRGFDAEDVSATFTSCAAAEVDNLADEYGGGKLKIVAGRYYKTRDGRKVGPMIHDGYGSHPWSGHIEDGGEPTYTANGRWWTDDSEDDYDLIAEWPVEVAPVDVVAPATTVEPDSKLLVTISADTSALDAEIDRVKRRLKKLAKRARKLGIDLDFGDLREAA